MSYRRSKTQEDLANTRNLLKVGCPPKLRFLQRHKQRIHPRIKTVGEEHECDTVGAMLKILKSKKKIQYDRAFLMYPHNKNDIISLKGSKNAAGKTTDGTSGIANMR